MKRASVTSVVSCAAVAVGMVAICTVALGASPTGMNIVLIDAMNPFGYGCCLPLGRLREPLSALKDAQAIVITRSDAVVPEFVEALEAQLTRRAPRASMHLGVHKPIGLIDQDGLAANVCAKALCSQRFLKSRQICKARGSLVHQPATATRRGNQ